MSAREDIMFNVVIILVAVGFYVLGRYHQLRKTYHWRLRWIQVEHPLARLQGREPRSTESMEDTEPLTPPPSPKNSNNP